MVGEIYSCSYGKFEVIEYKNNASIKVRFIDTGYELVTQKSHIKRGLVKDKMKPSVFGVGFIGDGVYKSRVCGIKSSTYKAWISMLQRCYCQKYLTKRPTYTGVTVCKEWHNFQNFAEWYENNFPKVGGRWQLDKDLKSGSDRIYSPETCTFLSCEDNCAVSFGKKVKFISPSGDVVERKSISALAREFGLNRALMSAVSTGSRKSHKGWKLYNGS